MDFSHSSSNPGFVYSRNPGFVYSAVTLLKRVPESAEHQHLHPLDLFQFSNDGFRRQNIVSEGHERVHTYATEKTLRQMTLDWENTHLPIRVSAVFLLSQQVGEQYQKFAFVSAHPKLSCLVPHLCAVGQRPTGIHHMTLQQKMSILVWKSTAENENKVKCPKAPRAPVWC